MMPVPVTLVAAAAAVFVNIWLGWRIAQYREDFKVSVGDGGHEPLLRRMRAQANFTENAPFFLILVGGLELSGADRLILGIVAAIFILARIAHAIGMDSADNRRWRMLGMIGTSLPLLGLALWALVCAAEHCLGR
ncbi:MAG: MAPEG family protein [Pseudomonadota bacterium]